MINRVTFTNFKSLKKAEIDFKKITVLAGLNSAGKSSVIQGLLLTRNLAEHLKNKPSESQSKIPLNGSYMLSLGTPVDVISRDSGKEFSIELNADLHDIKNRFYTDRLSDTVYDIAVEVGDNFSETGIYKSSFYYLNAERLGPRIRHWVNEKGGSLHCGFRGEYTAEILARTKAGRSNVEVTELKQLNKKKLEGFQSIPAYASQWMEYIAAGTDIGDAEIISKLRSASIILNGNIPPNVGFGLSYALPIIVTGLLAEAGSLMIVENPEAHLHPSGQSNIGFFLGQMAASGIQIVIETHSEHVINGIRRAVLVNNELSAHDATIAFFSGLNESKESKIDHIYLTESGDMTSFPRDFFDQVQQDMAEIFRLAKRRTNG